MAPEMNVVSIASEMLSIKTTPTQRRSRENRVEHIDREDQESATHSHETETNKANIETKKGSEK